MFSNHKITTAARHFVCLLFGERPIQSCPFFSLTGAMSPRAGTVTIPFSRQTARPFRRFSKMQNNYPMVVVPGWQQQFLSISIVLLTSAFAGDAAAGIAGLFAGCDKRRKARRRDDFFDHRLKGRLQSAAYLKTEKRPRSIAMQHRRHVFVYKCRGGNAGNPRVFAMTSTIVFVDGAVKANACRHGRSEIRRDGQNCQLQPFRRLGKCDGSRMPFSNHYYSGLAAALSVKPDKLRADAFFFLQRSI